MYSNLAGCDMYKLLKPRFLSYLINNYTEFCIPLDNIDRDSL